MVSRSTIAPALLLICLLMGTFPLAAHGVTGFTAANGVIGQPNLSSNSTETTQDGLYHPYGLVFDSSGDLWASDSANNRILEYKAPLTSSESASVVLGQSSFTADGAATTQTGLSHPEGVAFDSQGDLWVADTGNNRVLEFPAPFSDGESASVVLGQPSFTSTSSNTSQSSLADPEGLAFDSHGDLWVADSGNDRVVEYTAPFSTGEAASVVLGQLNFTARGPLTAANRMYIPSTVIFDSKGDMWVADGGDCRILEFTQPFSTGESASFVLGQVDLNHNETTTYVWPYSGRTVSVLLSTSTQSVHYPDGMAFDSQGNLWVSDTLDNRVVEFTTPFSTDEVINREVGQLNFTTNSTGTGASGIFHPEGLTFDSHGDLWVADSYNSRIIEYTSPGSVGMSSSQEPGPANDNTILAAASLVAFFVVATYLLIRRSRKARTLKGAQAGDTSWAKP